LVIKGWRSSIVSAGGHQSMHAADKQAGLMYNGDYVDA
jgi:hypothetical protein